MAAEFLKMHSDLTINEIPLIAAVQSEFKSMKQYIKKVVLKDSEDARLIVIAIMPIALRISLDCVYLDMHDEENVFYLYCFDNNILF